MSITIVVADDHPIMREGLCSLIQRESDMIIVGEADNGQSLIELTGTKCPDIAVLDISMPVLNGIEAARQIATAAPGTKVICLSMHHERKFIEAMIEAGALGYLLKNDVPKELVNAIRLVAAGKTYLSPSIATDATRSLFETRRASTSGIFSQISVRERQILQLVVEGHPNKDIGTRLNLSEKTVTSHRVALMNKLGIHNLAELTRFAIREGIIEP